MKTLLVCMTVAIALVVITSAYPDKPNAKKASSEEKGASGGTTTSTAAPAKGSAPATGSSTTTTAAPRASNKNIFGKFLNVANQYFT